MNNNYEVVYVDGIDIEQAIDFIDVEDMAQHIYFGPQAEIMEKLNIFNQRYQAGLSVTKTFRWSPGTYDKVAELMMKKVGLRRRASGMYNYLSREDYWWRSGRHHIQNELREMDQMISRLRYDRVTWMDDPAMLIERKDTFKNYVCEKFEQFLEITSQIDKITVLNILLENDGGATTRSLRLTINICLSPGEIQIYNADSRSYDRVDDNGDPLPLNEPTHIQNLPVDMDILLKIQLYPLQEMTRNNNYDRPRFGIHTYGRAESYDERGILTFPYISQNRQRFNQSERWGTICYGDDSTDINNALNRFELPAYAMLLMNWMNRYTQNTNPYNNIKALYHGEPKWLTDAYRTIFGTNRWEDCQYRPSGTEDYCDTNECALRHTCQVYKAAYPEPVSPEQAEQLTLQWATRMGGVGANAAPTITHSVNNEGEPTSTTNDLVETPIQGDREQDHLVETPNMYNPQPQGDHEQDHIDTDGLAQELIDHETVLEEIRQTEEERRINAEMDAEEAQLEATIRDAQENPEPNNEEE